MDDGPAARDREAVWLGRAKAAFSADNPVIYQSMGSDRRPSDMTATTS